MQVRPVRLSNKLVDCVEHYAHCNQPHHFFRIWGFPTKIILFWIGAFLFKRKKYCWCSCMRFNSFFKCFKLNMYNIFKLSFSWNLFFSVLFVYSADISHDGDTFAALGKWYDNKLLFNAIVLYYSLSVVLVIFVYHIFPFVSDTI